MTPEYDVTTRIAWKPSDQKRSIVIEHGPAGDMDIVYIHDGCEDQRLELDETAWHALFAMMGEVRP